MKFKTRLRVTFIIIILLPMALMAFAFCGIGLYLMNVQKGLPIDQIDYTFMSENMQEMVNATEKAYLTLWEQAQTDPSKLADREYLDQVSSKIARRSTYIIVRKEDELYYAGNEPAAKLIFPKLPDYGEDDISHESGYYYDEYDKYVKQIDFLFPDGSRGSVFVVSRVNALISRHLLIDMMAILLILIFTGVMLTRWIHKGVFDPINELNTAMQEIKEGNLEYALETDAKGEIGDLYRNYEDMRLQLKESTEENREN